MRQHEHFQRLGYWHGVCVVLALCFGVGLAQAGTSADLHWQLTGFMPNPGGGYIRVDSVNGPTAGARVWSQAMQGGVGKVIATDAVVIAGRAGALPVAAAYTATIGESAAAVARCLLTPASPVCVGATVALTAAAFVYDKYRVHHPSHVPGSQVGTTLLDYDPGQATTPTSQACYTNSTYQAACVGSAEAVYASVVSQNMASGYWNDYTVLQNTTGGCSQGQTNCFYRQFDFKHLNSNGSVGDHNYVTAFVSRGTDQTISGCGPSIDPFDSQYNVPAGSPVGLDGKCPTARYNHVGISAVEAQSKVTAYPPSFADTTLANKWRDAVRDSVDTGRTNLPSVISTTGPASQTGSPTTTTTTTSGGTITETKTPTYTYSYNGDTITYTTTNTTVTNNNGVITTTTINEAAPTGQDPKDPCTVEPERVGCLKLGEVEAVELPKKTATLDYSEESVGLPASCPAPFNLTFMGTAHAVSYTQVCDAAVAISPYVRAVGAFSALLLVLSAVRQL